jgi:hypothetical protein
MYLLSFRNLWPYTMQWMGSNCRDFRRHSILQWNVFYNIYRNNNLPKGF